MTAPLPVRGIDWEIPIIDPKHFTTKEFKKCIKACTQLSKTQLKSEAHDRELQWVWVDVACIDQRDASPEKAVEVGRQAAIFRNATRGFVWINTYGTDELTALVKQLQDLTLKAAKLRHLAWKNNPRFLDLSKVTPTQAAAQREDYWKQKGIGVDLGAFNGPKPQMYRIAENEEWLTNVIECLQRLLGSSDPKRPGSWFTSMWTLQEAFLWPRAGLLSKDGEPVYLDNSRISVWSLCIDCKNLETFCAEDLRNRRALGEPVNKSSLKLLELIEHSGLAALYACNPMALYTVAKNRKPTRDEDRVYGIMQVFDLQLGRSAPGVDHSRRWSLELLELQLCSELLMRFPLQTQLCVHAKEMRPGHAWRVGASSVLPMLERDLSYDFKGAMTGGPATMHASLCTWEVESTTWAKFSGEIIDFEYIQQAWLSMDRLIGASRRREAAPVGNATQPRSSFRPSNLDQPADGWSVHQIALDDGRFALPTFFDRVETPRGQPQRELAAAIVIQDREMTESSEAQHRVQVLRLGEFHYDKYSVYMEQPRRDNEPRKGQTVVAGLLLREMQGEKFTWWARLGVCTWDVSDLDVESG